MIGMIKVGHYTGYGLELKLVDENNYFESNTNRNKRAIIAMDALCFEEVDFFSDFLESEKLRDQIPSLYLDRDFSKVMCAFSKTEKIGTPYLISTGLWGCGSFNGNKELKTLIQWIAATITGAKQINFHLFSDETKFINLMKKLVSTTIGHKVLVKDIIEVIETTREECNLSKKSKLQKEISLFEKIITHTTHM